VTATDSVKALVDDLKEGNQAAQEQLLARYGDMLLRFIVAVLKADQLEAEDIAVETLYRAIEKIDSFEFRSGSPNGFRNWLFQIAKNNFRDRRRLEFELEPFDEETLRRPF
jgi:DNA-directed RNA polymerase specialized sigma24 family protein